MRVVVVLQTYPAVVEELDLVEEEDVITHTAMLEDAGDPENILNVFRLDADFAKNEEMYAEIRKSILGEDGGSGDEGEEGSEEEDLDAAGDPARQQVILDNTEGNMVAYRRLVYLTIQSSLNYEEAAHKLLKQEIKPELQVPTPTSLLPSSRLLRVALDRRSSAT